jgi:(p)ppGpp synthase/HD superfamily hydrolase
MRYSYRIEQAIRAAAILHKDQIRKGEVPYPYVTHVYAVACIVSDYTDNEDAIIAALLHDTLEDTDYTSDEIADDFGPVVRDLVESISESINKEKPLSWQDIKREQLKKLRKAPESALIVAAADKIHNMRSTIEEYYDDYERFIADFGGTLEERMFIYQEMSNIFNRNIKNQILSEFNYVFDEYKTFIENIERKRSELL